jgi:restriction endonuclease S subunit
VAPDGEVTPTASLPTRPLQLVPGDERYLARAGDILISARGTQLKTGWARKENRGAVVSSTLIIVRASPTIDASILFATLMSQHGQGQLQSRARHSTSTLVLNVQDVATIEIPIPPVEAQRQIRKLITLGESHYRVVMRAASQRRDLAHALAQGLLFGEVVVPGNSAGTDR